MILLTPQLQSALRANAITKRFCEQRGEPFHPVPLVKLFNPVGAATWLASELEQDCDTLFGFADLGFGCPELGVFSLSEIASIRLPFGLGIERDLSFESAHPISTWAESACRTGSILAAETGLRRAVRSGPNSHDDDPELPSPPR